MGAAVTSNHRAALFGPELIALWLTGLSASGKSTLAKAFEHRRVDTGKAWYHQPDHGLNGDLGFSPHDRHENIRRAPEVAGLMNDAGLIVITAFISPYGDDREIARRIIGESRFAEVHLSCDLATCGWRDPEGHYAKARLGKIRKFTGINAPYEVPEAPELMLDTAALPVRACVEQLIEETQRRTLARNALGVRSRTP